MGCEISPQNSYNEGSHSDLESGIRDFEMKLGTFNLTFSEINTRINARLLNNKNEIPSENLFTFLGINSLLREESFKTLLANEIFRVDSQNEQPYDTSRIKTLFFLLTRSNLDGEYQDKAKFLYFSLKKSLADNFSEVLDIENFNLSQFLEIAVNLSIETLVDAYYTQFPNASKENEILKLRENKIEIIEAVKNELFASTSGNQMTFSDLNNLLQKNQFTLTSGFIRQVGYNTMIKNAAKAEAEKKELEKEKKEEVEPVKEDKPAEEVLKP